MFNSPWSFAGVPTISVPAGWSPDGLPYAVQLTGITDGERELFSASYWTESVLAFERRLPPVT
jgi:amidase